MVGKMNRSPRQGGAKLLQLQSRDPNGKMTTASQTRVQGEAAAERTLKIIVVGDIATGKTSIIRRYVHNLFSNNYQATIGIDFALKIIRWSELDLKLQFWDIAGQERFSSMTRVYYRGATAAIVVFDVSRGSTMQSAAKWKEDIDAKCRVYGDRQFPSILLANKYDLLHGQLDVVQKKVDDFCKKHNFSAWFPTSAKENVGIDNAVQFLCKCILTKDNESEFEISVTQSFDNLTLQDTAATRGRKNSLSPYCCNN